MKKIVKDNIPSELYQSMVVLYGGGITCRRILELLKPYQINISYIIDDDINKCGSKIENIEIISYEKFEDICNQFNRVSVILTSIYGKLILGRLNEVENIDVFEMYNWLDNVYRLNSLVGGLDDEGRVKLFKRECLLLANKFIDAESRKVLEGLCTYLDTKDSNILSDICTEHEQYFIPEVLSVLYEPLSLVDGGSYMGELYQAIKNYNINLERWYCFEADEDNYNKLLLQSSKNELDGIQVCINKGLWSKEGILYFDGDKDTSSRIVSYKTNNQIEVLSLDSYFEDKYCNFIKMDIEGAEYPALCGGIKTIKRDRPILAISIYHSLEDYYRIPNYLMRELQNYHYCIRHHALIFSETVLYAIPNELYHKAK